MQDRDGVEHLTPEEHLEKADAAWSAAKKLRGEMDDREVAEGRARGKTSEWYLTREHDFLTLCQIVNLHANMATAKSLVLLKSRSVPIEFNVPGITFNDKGEIEFQPAGTPTSETVYQCQWCISSKNAGANVDIEDYSTVKDAHLHSKESHPGLAIWTKSTRKPIPPTRPSPTRGAL